MSKSPKNPRRSTTSWTIPKAGEVILYAYLWADEAARGQEEGLKDRPTVVVIARRDLPSGPELMVAPVTHSAPKTADDAIELPQKVKRHLGLDAERSWIVISELNHFRWPGPDVRIALGGDGSPVYGAIPELLFDVVREQVLKRWEARKLRVTPRSS